MIIKIIHKQHFIEGDRYFAFLISGNEQVILVAGDVQPENYLEMCEKLLELKTTLEKLGNEVHICLKHEPDPNFKTEADAEDYLDNKEEYLKNMGK